jgi:NADH-quinone oxidoreductase subunit D
VPVGLGEMGTVGDCWDRYMVRVREIEQMPDGPYLSLELHKPLRVPAGAAYTRVESSKGELGHYLVSDGGQTAFRNKVRSPSFCNLQVMETAGPGLMISDLVALIGSLDIVLGEIDR